MPIFKTTRAFFINDVKIETTEQLAQFVQEHGEEDVYPHTKYMKCILLDLEDELPTETGIILYANEDGNFVSDRIFYFNIGLHFKSNR